MSNIVSFFRRMKIASGSHKCRLLVSVLLIALMSSMTSPLMAQDLGTVNFDFDSDNIDAQAMAEIEEIANRLKENPSYRPTVVIGYTDAVGSSGYNNDLGLRRANAAAKALIAAGVPVSRIGSVSSRGKNELLVRVSAPERRNRRVTVTLDDMLAACRSYREIVINDGAPESLQSELKRLLEVAKTESRNLSASGYNGPAFQMAGAAIEDCSTAAGFASTASRKTEYAKRCFCSSARLQVASGN